MLPYLRVADGFLCHLVSLYFLLCRIGLWVINTKRTFVLGNTESACLSPVPGDLKTSLRFLFLLTYLSWPRPPAGHSPPANLGRLPRPSSEAQAYLANSTVADNSEGILLGLPLSYLPSVSLAPLYFLAAVALSWAVWLFLESNGWTIVQFIVHNYFHGTGRVELRWQPCHWSDMTPLW